MTSPVERPAQTRIFAKSVKTRVVKDQVCRRFAPKATPAAARVRAWHAIRRELQRTRRPAHDAGRYGRIDFDGPGKSGSILAWKHQRGAELTVALVCFQARLARPGKFQALTDILQRHAIALAFGIACR